MEKEMTDFIIGSPVRDNDFWFRNDFVEDLWESLQKHNVLLLAPRRIGKTSVMYRMLDCPRDNWLVVHLNVEDIETPDDFFITLLSVINEHQPHYLQMLCARAGGFIGSILQHIESVETDEFKISLRKAQETIKADWQEKLQKLIEEILNSDRYFLFIVDEFPDMVSGMIRNSPESYENFLHWFRKMRMESLSGKVRWLVGGSVNLTAVLAREGMVNLSNDLKVEVLSPFSPYEVQEFVTKMLTERGVTFDETLLPRVGELLGTPLPFFLQMLVQEIFRLWKKQQTTINADIVTAVFNKALLGEMGNEKLQHFRSRIYRHYPPEEQETALYLLNRISSSKRGISRNMLFSHYKKIKESKCIRQEGEDWELAFQSLIMNLRSDFYIEETENGSYDFASRLLKLWWKKHYGYKS